MQIQKLKSAVNSIIEKIDNGDVAAVYSESVPVDFEMDKLKSVENINRFSIGLRLFETGRVGNSYINSLDKIDELIANAQSSAELGDESSIELPPMNDFPKLIQYHQEVVDFGKDEIIKIGEEAVKTLKAVDERLKVSVEISKGCSTNLLVNTTGLSAETTETGFSLYISVNFVEDNGGLLDIGDSDSSYDLNIDREVMYEKIEWRFKNAMKKATLDTGNYPVIFTPETMGNLLSPIKIAANSKNLYKGISVLGDKVGQQIANENFSITDDALYKDGLGSYAYDDEGIIPKKLPIIENGIFKNFVYDLTYAQRLNAESNGHAARGIVSLPEPSFSNLILSTGDATLDELIKSVDRGLIVYSVLGGGMSNLIAGDISVNIELGYLIEKGKIVGRVKDMMLAGNVYDFINSIGAMENKLNKRGSLYTPHILIDNVSISGK